jgi:hypothetical protein
MSERLELISLYNLQAAITASRVAVKYTDKLTLNSYLVFKLVLAKCKQLNKVLRESLEIHQQLLFTLNLVEITFRTSELV